VQVAAGDAHTCALRASGRVDCWGAGSRGQLGNGSMTASLSPVQILRYDGEAVAITSGGFHSCLRTSTPVDVWCWGAGGVGQVGDGDRVDRLSPVKVDSSMTASWDVLGVSAGTSHTCAARVTSSVVCWGDNGQGQLGLAGAMAVEAPALSVEGLAIASSVSAGWLHTCAIVGGAVHCWGNNTYWQLGQDVPDSHVPVAAGVPMSAESISAGQEFTCATFADGSAQCWGRATEGQIGDGGATGPRALPAPVALPEIALDLDAGGEHACAIARGTHTVYCWGNNREGQLGSATTGSASSTPIAAFENAANVSAGRTHTCAALRDGRVACWGGNDSGQLGDGTMESHSTPTFVPLP